MIALEDVVFIHLDDAYPVPRRWGVDGMEQYKPDDEGSLATGAGWSSHSYGGNGAGDGSKPYSDWGFYKEHQKFYKLIANPN